MAEDFFQCLVDCIEQEGRKRPGQSIDPEVLREFMTGSMVAPVSPARVAIPRPVPAPPQAQPVRRTPMEIPHPAESTRIAPPPVVLDMNTLDELRPIVLGCTRCALAATRNNVVFGEGNPQARLMFIGEGPGYDEDMQGRPFVGKAGQLLDKMITAMQFTREEVYIANVVKCRPPDNRVPSPDEALACIGYLKKQIALIKPEAIVLLGATAVGFLLGKREGITRLRGKWLGFDGIPVMPTYHPAYLLRQESAKRDAWADLQQVMKVFGKAHPGRH